MVHDRRVDGKELTLGVSGKLVDGNLVMYDTQSDSLWLQSSGEGLEGARRGQKLEELPAEAWGVVRWGEWRQQHPETLVLTCAHCEGRGEMTGTIDELHREREAAAADR
ncbi:MAG: DUF3179 domain-containing protein [Acidobacteria bacterium]|nr:DUF3179 domain-containing protein [Acidobacteriota bacterium]